MYFSKTQFNNRKRLDIPQWGRIFHQGPRQRQEQSVKLRRHTQGGQLVQELRPAEHQRCVPGRAELRHHSPFLFLLERSSVPVGEEQ